MPGIDQQIDERHCEIDSNGSMVNRRGVLYHDYMRQWREPSGYPVRWIEATVTAAFFGWLFYRRWRAAQRPKHRPIGIEDQRRGEACREN